MKVLLQVVKGSPRQLGGAVEGSEEEARGSMGAQEYAAFGRRLADETEADCLIANLGRGYAPVKKTGQYAGEQFGRTHIRGRCGACRDRRSTADSGRAEDIDLHDGPPVTLPLEVNLFSFTGPMWVGQSKKGSGGPSL
jgi:hypothetical protein